MFTVQGERKKDITNICGKAGLRCGILVITLLASPQTLLSHGRRMLNHAPPTCYNTPTIQRRSGLILSATKNKNSAVTNCFPLL